MAKKILDTGIIVGGAKKERVTTSSKENKDAKTKGLPQWLPKGIEVCLLTERNGCKKALRYEKFGDGPWGIYERSYFSWRLLGEGFETREEAVAKLPYLFWSKVLYIGCKGGVFCIYKRMRSAKQLLPCKDGFETEDDAKKYASEHAAELVVARSLNPVLPTLKTVRRVGPDYREGRDITGEELCATFGLCGVEYGEWLPDKERQESLNSCFDAFCDLADVLKVERTAIGFHGLQAVAFGSRGVSNALAHFEPLRFVFNLTRMKGAGSVAHEWFHAFDYYMGARRTGIALDRRDPDLYNKTKFVVAITEHLFNDDPFADLVSGLKGHYLFGEEAKQWLIEKREGIFSRYLLAADDFVRALSEGCCCPVTADQRQRATALVDHLSSWVHDSDLYKRDTDELKRLFSDAMGWSVYRFSVSHACSRLLCIAREYMKVMESEKRNDQKVCVGRSKYYIESMLIDLGRCKPYWSKTLELAARAFGAYVERRLEADGRLSQFLVHSHKNECYSAANPYPEGAELDYIENLFDSLFSSVSI